MVRVLLADDHEVVRRGMREFIKDAHPDWQICSEAADGREAVTLAAQHRPDVAVLDLSMPELNGLDAARQIRRDLPHTEVLIFTLHESEQLVREALAAGARGFVLKTDASRHLIAALESLARHQPFFSAEVTEQILQILPGAGKKAERGGAGVGSVDRPSGLLSPREREIVQLLAEGRTNKEVAARLHLSVKTVETHRANIMRKLGAQSVVELVHYAVRNQLIQLS